MLLSVNAGLFTYMFSSFYIKSYKKRPSKTQLNDISANNNSLSKNHSLEQNIAEKTKEALNVASKKSN